MRAALSTKHLTLPRDDIAAGLPVVIDDGSKYVYGAGLEEMVVSGNSYYYLADGLGSTTAIVDTTGAVQKSYTYDVYGKPTATGTLPNEFDFAGQQTDPTGLQYLRARYLDPETGTFLSREPMAVGPGWTGHHFGYAVGNPALMADPSGLSPVDGNGCGLGDSGCTGRDRVHWGPQYFCGAAGCLWDYDWQFLGGLEYYANGYGYYAWALDASGNPLVGHCILTDEYGQQCSVKAQTSFFPWNFIDGKLDHWAKVIKACPSDPAFCALVIGTQAATAIISATVFSAIGVACVETGGLVCAILVPGSSVLHVVTFMSLNKGLQDELIERGRRNGAVE